MPAATLDLKEENVLEAGSTFKRTWQLMNTETGLPHDLTDIEAGDGFTSSFRLLHTDALAVFTATIVIDNAVNGIITYTITAYDTSDYADGKSDSELQGVWDLEGHEGGGSPEVVTRFLEGTWYMTPEVTRE